MRAYWKRLAAGFLLLVLALFGGLYSLFDPFALTADAALLLPLCVLAALVGAAVHALPEGKWHTLAALAVCAALLLVLRLQGEALIAGGQVVFHQISLGFHQQLPKILFYELPDALLSAGADTLARASTLYLAFALFPISLWLGQWLLRGWPVWPGLVPLCALPGLGLFILRQPHPMSLAACLLALALIVLSRRGYQEDPCLGSHRVLVAALPVCLVMALLLLLFPPERYVRPLWAEDLRQGFKSLDVPLPSWVSTGRGNATGTQPFSRFGPPRFDGHTALTVEVQGEPLDGPLLLRGFSAGVYTSSGWQPCQEPPENAGSALSLYPVRASGVALGQEDERTRTLTVTDVGTNSTYYYRPYFPVSYPYDAAQLTDAYLLRPAGEESYQVAYLPQEEVPPGASLENETGRIAERRYRQWVYENYLDVPEELLTPEALEIIRLGAAQAETTHSYVDQRAAILAQAKSVADYLASFTSYDLFASSAPLGEDMISYFLTQSHRGYCTHYATAATLILRQAGLPARFTAGYSVDLAGKEGPVDVPDQNAHAWVEVYVAGFGWQPVDVTPPSYPGSGTEVRASQAPTPTPTPSQAPSPTPTPGATAAPSAQPSVPPSQAPGGGAKGSGVLGAFLSTALLLLPWGLGLCLVMGGVYLQRRLRLSRRRKACTQDDPNAAALALYGYLLAALRRGGTSLPEAAVELAKKAAFSQHTLTPAERQAMEGYARTAQRALSAAPWYRRLLLRYLWALC